MAGQQNIDFELVLVNNNSTDNTSVVCEQFIQMNPQLTVRYFVEENQGLSHARNRGVSEAQGDYLVFLDDDAFAFPDYIRNLQHFIIGHPGFQAGGGKILPFWESECPQWMSKYLLSTVSSIDLGNKVKLFGGRSYPIGANMIIKKTVFDRFGLFNIHLGRKGKNLEGSEEKDLFLRIKKENIPVYYIPNVIIEHWIPDSRLTPDFFNRLAFSMGQSEKVRAKSISSLEYLKSCLRELFKWGATLVLLTGYTLTGSYKKGRKLVVFRWNVSKGVFILFFIQIIQLCLIH
jgi:glycosyltransferase involved in cell wall biosynthesis